MAANHECLVGTIPEDVADARAEVVRELLRRSEYRQLREVEVVYLSAPEEDNE
jgi:hypothetical protein